MDNLKTIMVAWIIGGHALLGYSGIGGWPYDEVNEVTFGPRLELVLAALIGPSALFVIGTFFFVAGLFAPQAIERKGPRRFAAQRLLRLGLPFAAFALLVWPLCMWAAYRAAGNGVTYWWVFTHREPLLDSGPLWFAEVLLLFSLCYAAVYRLGGARASGRPLSVRHLVLFGAGVAVASFVVRLWFSARSTQLLDLHLWQWPQCAAMFGLGIVAARRGWAAQVPERLWRGCRVVVVLTVASLPVFAVVLGFTELAHDATPFLGGWTWQALLMATIEATLVVAGSLWLLGLAQRRITGDGPLATACARGAFAAFVLQAPVLLGLAIAARPLAVPAETKAFLVGTLGIVLCFWLGWLLTTRTRVSRVV